MARFGRRSFLRGAGALTLSLPLLESRDAAAQAAPPKTLFLVHNHGGTVSAMNRSPSMSDGRGDHHGLHWWHPLADDETLTAGNLGLIHSGLLDDFVDQLILFRGIDNEAANAQAPYGGGGHGWVNCTHLTCADCHTETVDGKTEPTGAKGPSFDKLLAAHLAGSAPFDAIDLMVRGHNYGTVQYLGDRQPVSSERDPRTAFERIFAGVSPSDTGPDPELLRLRARRQSVLDGVLGAFNLLRGRVSTQDRRTLDAHADHLRAIERRIDALDGVLAPMCTTPDIADVSDREAEQVGPLMMDIAIHAGRCNLSPVIAIQIGDIITSWLGTPYGVDLAHSLGHAAREVGPTGPNAGRRAAWEEEMRSNRRWRLSLFQRLLQGLADTPAGDGTLLDSSLCVYTSEFSNAAVHSSRDVPFVFAGSLGGTFRTGRFLDYNMAAPGGYETSASTHNLYTSILQGFGMEIDHFGGPHAYFDGPLPGLR
ncbi:MAG: DUF1552 domain-containing protein [Myxococcota bacterium]